MKQFMDKDFLLSTDMAKSLNHDYAENMPILRKFMRTASSTTSPRFGWAAITTSGARCAPTA